VAREISDIPKKTISRHGDGFFIYNFASCDAGVGVSSRTEL